MAMVMLYKYSNYIADCRSFCQFLRHSSPVLVHIVCTVPYRTRVWTYVPQAVCLTQHRIVTRCVPPQPTCPRCRISIDNRYDSG